MRLDLAFIPEIVSPETAALCFGVALEVEDPVRGTVVEVAVFWRLDESAVDVGGCVAAVELPGWVAFYTIACGFVEGDLGVAVAVGGAPDLAGTFAIADGGSLEAGFGCHSSLE